MAKGHKDKIAVITGAANGIGQAFAKRLAEDGVHIVIADVAPGDATVKMVEQAGRQALACKCDVTSEQSVAAMAAEVQKKFGRCDILINCAGIYPQQDFEQMKFEDWRRVLSINLDSVFLVSAAFAPGMKQRGWGRVVNMASSTLGSVVTGFVHYMSSKAGIVGFTRALATRARPLRRHRQRDLAGADAFARHARPQAAARHRRHGGGIQLRRHHAGDQAARGAGRSGRHGVVSDQRRRGLHHRADPERGRRPGPQLNRGPAARLRAGALFRARKPPRFVSCAD